MARPKIEIDRHRLSIMIPTALYEQVIAVCVEEGTTITNATREALRDWLKRKALEKKEDEELIYD